MEYKFEVSIVIPYYREVDWLIEALDSVAKQTFKNFEVIIVNDGSKDDLGEIIRKNEYNFPLKIINKENGGPASARNLGIISSNGKYIAFLDSDDIWREEKLKVQYTLMEKKQAVWSQHSYEYFYENGKRKSIDTSRYNANVYLNTFVSFKVQTSCVMIRKDALIDGTRLIISFREDQRYGQDIFLYRELARKYELLSIPDKLVLFRIRGKNAGFRPSVQLYSKSNTWEIEKMSSLKEIPRGIKIIYSLCSKNFFIWKKLPTVFKNETTAGFLYLYPYCLLKVYQYLNREQL